MKLSVRDSLRYPVAYPITRHRSVVLLVLSVIPFVGSFFAAPYATAAVSVITMERNPEAVLDRSELMTRAIRALLAGFVSFLYLLPALVIGTLIGVFWAKDRNITVPVITLAIYSTVVISAWPLATLHAVTQRSAWQALALPQLLWIGLKVDFKTFGKVMLVSVLLFFLKVFAGFMDLWGLGLLLVPAKAYSEYVFQYLLAVSYAGVVVPHI